MGDGSILMLYGGNNRVRQHPCGRSCKSSIWGEKKSEKFNFNSWIETHYIFWLEKHLLDYRDTSDFTMSEKNKTLRLSFEAQDITHTPLIKKIRAFLIIYLFTRKLFKPAIARWSSKRSSCIIYSLTNTRLDISFTLFISFCASHASAVRHCLRPCPWLMFTGHSNTLNSLVRKGKMGALAGVRYCAATEGATPVGRHRKLASVW